MAYAPSADTAKKTDFFSIHDKRRAVEKSRHAYSFMRCMEAIIYLNTHRSPYSEKKFLSLHDKYIGEYIPGYKILIMDEKYLEPSKDEIVMAFVASCIEDVADRLNVPYIDVFERMDRVGLIDKYIYHHYETLHTESRDNLTSDLIDTLKRWEEANER